MIVVFEKQYLKELYETGKTSDKKHRFQPPIIRKYGQVINRMVFETDISGLMKYGSLHYEHLHGDKEGLSSVRVNDQYRVEFREHTVEGKLVATICEITELSNHYK